MTPRNCIKFRKLKLYPYRRSSNAFPLAPEYFNTNTLDEINLKAKCEHINLLIMHYIFELQSYQAMLRNGH